MEEKELNSLLEKVNQEVKKGVQVMFDDALKGILKETDLPEKVKSLGLDPATLKAVDEALKAQGEKINELMTRPQPKKVQKIEDFIADNLAKLTQLKADHKGAMILNVPMTHKTITVNSSITSDAGGYMIPGFDDYPVPAMGLQAAFTIRPLPVNHHGIIRFTYESTHTENGGFTAEGSAATSDVHAWTSSYVTVEKVFAHEKISYEALNDVTDMSAALQRLLATTLWQKRETGLCYGNGTPPQIYGLYTNATAFDYAAWSGITTKSANLYDLAMLLKSEISRLYGGKFLANVVCLNPTDLLDAQWNKASNGQYILNPFVSPDGMNIGGMRVVVSPAITANTMMVGDSRFAELYLADNVEIEVGYNDDDFKSDLVTMKARHRLAVKMSPNDKLGWYKVASISAALTAITDVEA